MADEQVDPRYDRAFQRGFDGQVATGSRDSSALRRTALVTPAPGRSMVPSPNVVASPQPVASSAGEVPVGEVPAVADAVADETEPTPRRDVRRNPFLIAVLVLGAALVAGGLAWANQGRDIVTSHGGATTELDYWFIQATVFGSPIAVALGIALIAGVLFFFAYAWNRR